MEPEEVGSSGPTPRRSLGEGTFHWARGVVSPGAELSNVSIAHVSLTDSASQRLLQPLGRSLG